MTGKLTLEREIVATLNWYLAAGVDECVGEEPIDRYAESRVRRTAVAAERPAGSVPGAQKPPAMPPKRRDDRPRGEEALRSALEAASSCETIEDLKTALDAFEGCPLKAMANSTVFADGDAKAKVVLVGEAPGAEEDRRGRPFCGPSGRLLNAMLASIGLDRGDVLITNTVFWRPPGNRTPSNAETAVCLPFLEKLIAIVNPRILIALGGPAAKELLGSKESVSKLRGSWHGYANPGLSRPIAATALYHPAYLLRTPTQKRRTWADLLKIKQKISEY